MPSKTDLLQGTLDVLILKTLALAPMHGWGIAQRIQQLSEEVLQVNQGSLYPALYRLEAKGWIRSDWGNSENNRRAKFYELTRTGRRQLAEETDGWERVAAAVGRGLEANEGGGGSHDETIHGSLGGARPERKPRRRDGPRGAFPASKG